MPVNKLCPYIEYIHTAHFKEKITNDKKVPMITALLDLRHTCVSKIIIGT